MLGSSKLRQKIQARPNGGGPAALPSTCGAARIADDRTLKSCCQNILVVVAMFLSEIGNLWRTEQSSLNWDVNTSPVDVRPSGSAVHGASGAGLLVLENEAAMKQCGFLEVAASGSRSAQPSEAQCFVEDDAAELFGSCCWSLATARQAG